MRTIIVIIGVTALTAGTSTLHAQDAVMVDIAPCMALTASADKQACYEQLEQDARASAPAARSSATAAAVAPAAQAPMAPANTAAVPAASASNEQAVASFGTATPSTARVLTSTDGKQELHDRITDLREREPGRYLITLASGQVWYQSNSQRFRLREGMDVRIYPSPLGGSYRMARDDGRETGFVQVERLK